ncbi:MAG TPA: energy transducer TonB, partial [Terriglobales bacterium]|nr:energy transducer TonB [Terriglobales bacterium]
RALLAAVVVALGLPAWAQEAQAPAPIPRPAQLDQAIEDFARGIPAGITADRYAAFAVEMPKDEAEYKALNKHALLVVAALAKDASELPLQRVYLEQENRTTELSPFAVARSEMWAGSPAGKLMGTHRVDAYYLIPLSAWRQPGTLLADFAAHRQEFVLGKFPQEIKEEFIRNDAQPDPEQGRNIAAEAIGGMAQRAVPDWASSGQTVPAFICPQPLPAAPYAPCQPMPLRIRVSAEVAAGMLAYRVAPRYPEIAKAHRLQGWVVLHVIIGKDGKVQQLGVVSGHPVLVPAAMDAVRQWRYRPYLLQGQPVEVDTQVTIAFTLSGG